MQEMRVRSLGQEDPLKDGMATHSSTLAWRIPWPEEPGGLQSIGSQSQTRLKGLGTHAQGSDQSGKNYSVWDAGGRSCSQKLNEKGFGDSGE